MFILDSLMISGIRWALETALTAAEAEMNDDAVLREQLLEAEMRRETGEISDEAFRDIEADLLARIREIKERREGGAGPIAFGARSMEADQGQTVHVEASVAGDFHDAAAAPHTTVLAPLDEHSAVAGLVGTTGGETIAMLDMEPGDAAPPVTPPAAVEDGSAGARAARVRKRSTRPPRRQSRAARRSAETASTSVAPGSVPRTNAPRTAARKEPVPSPPAARIDGRRSGGSKRVAAPRRRSHQKAS